MPFDRGFNILVGPQSPEGYQSAPPGFVYIDQTNGQIYVKAQNTDDTGWRTLSALATRVVDDVTLDTTHDIVDVLKATAVAVTLPDAASSVGQVFTIRCSGAGDVTITPAGSDTVGGGASVVLTAVGDFATVYQPVAAGTDWLVLDSVVT